MALKTRSLIGIELHEQEVRIVEQKIRNGEPTITAVVTFTPHAGYLGEWGVNEPEMLAIQLKAAMQRVGIAPSDTAFGIPAWCCLQRPLSLPPVDEAEMHVIVQGEIEHTQMFRENDASFDLVRLNDSKLLESSGRNILLLGSEIRVLDSIRAVANFAGLKLVAIEPTHSALYRAAYAQATTSPNLFVTLSETHAEISLLDQGQLALHRTFALGGSIFDVPEPEDGSPRPRFEIDAASTLAVELRRSIDFIARELADAPVTEAINLACTHPDAPVLAHWLEAALRVRVEVADSGKIPSEPTVFGAMPPEEANRYVAAYGLTLRDHQYISNNVHIVNLLANEHVRMSAQDEINRKFRLAFVASLVLLACGAITATMGTFRANQAARDLKLSQNKLATTQAMERARTEEVTKRADRLRLLSAQGVPVRTMIQAVVRTVPPQVGLVEVRMSPTSTDISGETVSETAIIAMSDALRSNPRFSSVSLSWFERVNPAVPQDGERFRMNLLTLPPTVAPTTPVAAELTAARKGGQS